VKYEKEVQKIFPLNALKVAYRKGEKASTFSFTVKRIARKLLNS
jgi:hypothetical protein